MKMAKTLKNRGELVYNNKVGGVGLGSLKSFEIIEGGVKMATISSGRWDWWNEYTEEDRIVDCLNTLSDALGRWPKPEEVIEVWPEYTLRFLQNKFGSYDKIKEKACSKIYCKNQGYPIKQSPKKITFTGEQMRIIAEIKKRPQTEQKPTPTPQTTSMQPEPKAVPKVARPEPVQLGWGASSTSRAALSATQLASSRRTPARVEPERARPGRRPTFSDEQLLGCLRRIVAANGGEVPTWAHAKELLRQQPGSPSLVTLTNRIGPITSWKTKLEDAG